MLRNKPFNGVHGAVYFIRTGFCPTYVRPPSKIITNFTENPNPILIKIWKVEEVGFHYITLKCYSVLTPPKGMLLCVRLNIALTLIRFLFLKQKITFSVI